MRCGATALSDRRWCRCAGCPAVSNPPARCREQAVMSNVRISPDPVRGGPASMTYAELLRRSLEADAAGTLPPRDLVQAVLEQARRRAGGRSPPH